MGWNPTIRSNIKQFFIPKGVSYEKSVTQLPQFKYEEASDDLKDVIFNNYGNIYKFDRDSLVFTFELPQKEEEMNKYNVIVLQTGDKDIAAQRRDVKISFLLAHKKKKDLGSFFILKHLHFNFLFSTFVYN